ncbi:WD40 repeat protein [Ceratobasidium sp. AG-Ba]|nr:WD40 repeat protein [Ceratobasidium sp. AG-Ba]
MQHLLDDELFFDDSAPTPGTFQLPTDPDADGQDTNQRGLTALRALDVSIASDRRLRKLRNSAAEDTVSGREYESRLRRQFEKVHPVPEWAISRSKRTRRTSSASSSNSESEDEPEEDPTTGPIVVAAAPLDALPPTEIAVTRLRDANQAACSDGPVNSIEFHPSARVPVLMVAGADKRPTF